MTEVQGQEWPKVLTTLIFIFISLDLFYTIVYSRLCCRECWLVCWTETPLSKVHGISDPKSQPKLCSVPWLQGVNRAFFQARHFGTCLCFLCFPAKARLPPTSTGVAVSREHRLKLGRVNKQAGGVQYVLWSWPRQRRRKTNSLLLQGWLTSMMQAFGLAVPHERERERRERGEPEPGMFLLGFASLVLSHHCGRG